MRSGASFTESALAISLAILSLALSCWLARRPRRTATGITLGVVLGVVLFSLAPAFLDFLGHVVPFRQVDSWLAGLLSRIPG